jgi:hypothetical protein
MADQTLFIGWGQTVRGREGHALEVFGEATGMYGRMQEQGRIESFEVVLLVPHGGDLEGFMLLRGTQDQLNAIKADDEFRRNMVDASLVVDGLGMVDGYVNQGVEREMSIYTEAIQKVGAGATALAGVGANGG